MSEEILASDWSVLEPAPARLARMDKRVLEWLEAHETSLAAEWLGLVKLHPVEGLGYAAASAFALLLVTPIGWLGSLLF